MSGITRKSQDTAGGTLTGGSSDVLINGSGAVRIGDKVQPHGIGLHASPTMVSGSSTVFVNGIAVCRQGDSASCGHKSTGSGNVFAG